METYTMNETTEAYAIVPPDKDDLAEMPMIDSLAFTEEDAWKKFCGVVLKREAYEADGFKAKKVKLTIEVL